MEDLQPLAPLMRVVTLTDSGSKKEAHPWVRTGTAISKLVLNDIVPFLSVYLGLFLF